MLKVQDKAIGNRSNYVTEGFGLTFNEVKDKQIHYVNDWTISVNGKHYTGESVYDLMETLHQLKDEYKLKVRENGEKKFMFNKKEQSVVDKDILVIYTNQLWELHCYLKHYVTNEFMNDDGEFWYFQVLDNIEFRECWNDKLTEVDDISRWAQAFIDILFVKNKYFYLTPSQIMRKQIEKECKKAKMFMAKDIFPSNNFLYNYIRSALFGGLCYCPFPDKIFDQPIVEFDIKSAYIFCFLMAHCISNGKMVNPKHYEAYINNEKMLSIGRYVITYTSWSNKVKCYKNVNDEDCKKSENGEPVTDEFIFTNIDLALFTQLTNVISIECKSLMEFKSGYIQKEVLDKVIEAFIKKESSDKDSGEYAVYKVILNSIYGNTIRDWDAAQLTEQRDGASLAPQWGIFITAYCKKLLLGCALQLDGWVYSDTDSIFCFDTKHNREIIEEYNRKTRKQLKDICDDLGYDFEKLKHLGEFMEEIRVKKFRAWKQKQYALIDEHGDLKVTAAGCSMVSRKELTEEVFKEDSVPCGEKVIMKHSLNDEYETTINGRTYKTPSSYVKRYGKDDEAKNTIGFLLSIDRGD